jgi:pentalenic acid synthase
MDARDQLEEYFDELIDRKQKQPEPGDGVLDGLVHRQLRDGELTREKLIALAIILLVAGHETTANMISLGTYTLLQHPDRLAELRTDPALIPDAVEELMRMLSIADGLLRMALEDIEVAGATIRAGEGVVFSTSVVNRDEGVYADPDTLDWHRPARHHIAFGFGIHQCLGQPLARLELQVVYSTLYRRIPTLALATDVEKIPFKHDGSVYGVYELPVTWS